MSRFQTLTRYWMNSWTKTTTMSAPVSSQALRSPDLPQNPLAVLQNRRISHRRAAPSAFVSFVFAVIAANGNGQRAHRSTQLRDQPLRPPVIGVAKDCSCALWTAVRRTFHQSAEFHGA